MFSSDELDILIEEAMASLGVENNTQNNKSKSYNKNIKKPKQSKRTLTSAQALVIAGILGGSLSVDSVLVDSSQEINIVLTGSLKKKSNNDKLDGILDQLGRVPFDDVVAAMLRRMR